MQTYSEVQIVALAQETLQQQGILTAKDMRSEKFGLERMSSDGSTRRFWRCLVEGYSLCIVAAPLTTTVNECGESKSAWHIGNHLYSKGCAVPQVFGWHEESGMLLFEDLGNQRLHGLVVPENNSKGAPCQVEELYTTVVTELARMQIAGVVDFDPDWCWDGGHYNKELMLTRESNYFLNAFWVDFLQQNIPLGVEEEFEVIADFASQAPACYFLHRDFQSRNIMVLDAEPKFIDFQGGRVGPLGYDLASLLIDPYCRLKLSLQENLVDIYLKELSRHMKVDTVRFRTEYNALALQRNLQILGAFAFLTKVREKVFFADYLHPALQSAQVRLEEPMFADLKILKEMIRRALERI